MKLALKTEMVSCNQKIELLKKYLKKTNIHDKHRNTQQQCDVAFNRVHCLLEKR